MCNVEKQCVYPCFLGPEMDVYDDDVIQSLENNAVVKKLIKHERNKLIINTKGAYYYKKHDGKYQILTGLLPRLRKTFFPDINIYNLLKKPKNYAPKITKRRLMAMKKQQHQPKTKPPKTMGSKGWHYGKIRGTVVHQEVEDFIFLDRKNFCKKHPSIHVYTHRLLTFILEKMQWRLVRSEFDIFDERLGIGTSVDIVAVTNEGKLVLIEVKCGFSEYFDRYDGYMHGALKSLTDSPHHQANIQLITEALLIVKNHQIRLDDLLLYVIRVDDQGIYEHKINNAYVQKKGAAIYNDLLEARLSIPTSTSTTTNGVRYARFGSA